METESKLSRTRIVIKVHIEDEVISINVGKGEQTIKWLSLAAANRYKTIHQQHGRRRVRERSLKHIGNFIPRIIETEISKLEGDLLDPNTSIKDILVDGSEVWLDLDSNMVLTDRATPQLSHWRRLACEYSEDAVAHRDIEEGERLHKLSISRKKEAQLMAVKSRIFRQASISNVASEIFADVLSQDIEDLIEHDLDHMNMTKYTILTEKKIYQTFIRKNYIVLRNIYDSFSESHVELYPTEEHRVKIIRGIGISYNDFQGFCEDTNICHHEPAIKKAFGLSTSDSLARNVMAIKGPSSSVLRGTFKEKERTKDSMLTRVQFLESVLSLFTYSSSMKEKVSSDDQLEMELQAFMDQYFTPYHDLIDAGLSRSSIYTDETMDLFINYIDALKSIFNEYASIASVPVLSFKTFKHWCQAFQLLDDDDMKREKVPEEKWESDLKHCFLKSQFKSRKNPYTGQLTDKSPEIEFPEFLECICRLACKKYGHATGLTVCEKTKIVIQHIYGIYKKKISFQEKEGLNINKKK